MDGKTHVRGGLVGRRIAVCGNGCIVLILEKDKRYKAVILWLKEFFGGIKEKLAGIFKKKDRETVATENDAPSETLYDNAVESETSENQAAELETTENTTAEPDRTDDNAVERETTDKQAESEEKEEETTMTDNRKKYRYCFRYCYVCVCYRD